ncbi:TerC family protein [Paenibacillus endoradicis]|uniref:TerC family protein n=1 Tax=Paenibacillus endoradicis TaxID=2972487 RepID=UPI0021599BC9|nr:TerC family protein [Paenibacillus endoradicis]MCR8655977.1 TerC family protein [Paenibacillus endoradicis]MCR8658303.1 TerC family protein [Paenibacillus endoradicis]
MDSLIIFVEIVLINLLLSGDNAIVIAMVSNQLPIHQRNKAMWWGTLVAVFLRCFLVLLALPLLQIPFLQAFGGLLLLYISIKLLIDMQQAQHQEINMKKVTLMSGIWTIITADFVMSLDNVLAIAAVAKGDFILIMLGIALSIPMIIWGSKLLDHLMKRFPFLAYIGASLLAFAAGEMLIRDQGLHDIIFYKMTSSLTLIPLLCIPLVIIAAILRQKPIRK